MKILTPVNNPQEVEKIIQAGADEIYCGVLPGDWRNTYTNVASANRREWSSANLTNFSELKEVVDIASHHNVPVYLTLNALYTQKQYPLVLKQIEESKRAGVDALIVADLALLLTLKKKKIDLDIHISTGGTTFNSQTVKFYAELGAGRIILPRHLQIQEIEDIVRSSPGFKFEVFILNSGCKNIDGFCTFHHGVNEILHPHLWNLPKQLNFDRHFLNLIKRLPPKLSQRIRANLFGIDSACLLNYTVSFAGETNFGQKRKQFILKNIALSFNFLSGVDTCGVCRLQELEAMGVYGVKIVGRNYSLDKKIKDTRFLKTALTCIQNQSFEKEAFKFYVRDAFTKIYKNNCLNLCYYPDGM